MGRNAADLASRKVKEAEARSVGLHEGVVAWSISWTHGEPLLDFVCFHQLVALRGPGLCRELQYSPWCLARPGTGMGVPQSGMEQVLGKRLFSSAPSPFCSDKAVTWREKWPLSPSSPSPPPLQPR